MDYKIEKGVEIPEKLSNRKNRYPFKEMKVGDSFMAGEYTRHDMTRVSNAGRAYAWKMRLDWKFQCRKLEDGTFRCWRVK